MAQKVVHGGEIHVQGANKAGIKRNGFQFHHHVAAQFQMVENEVEFGASECCETNPEQHFVVHTTLFVRRQIPCAHFMIAQHNALNS